MLTCALLGAGHTAEAGQSASLWGSYADGEEGWKPTTPSYPITRRQGGELPFYIWLVQTAPTTSRGAAFNFTHLNTIPPP